MTYTKDELAWYRANHDHINELRDARNAKIAKHLQAAYDEMSELESTLNYGMAHAGFDSYALSRNRLHEDRIYIRSLARQSGMKGTEYPINLVGGIYADEDE